MVFFNGERRGGRCWFPSAVSGSRASVCPCSRPRHVVSSGRYVDGVVRTHHIPQPSHLNLVVVLGRRVVGYDVYVSFLGLAMLGRERRTCAMLTVVPVASDSPTVPSSSRPIRRFYLQKEFVDHLSRYKLFRYRHFEDPKASKPPMPINEIPRLYLSKNASKPAEDGDVELNMCCSG